MIATVNPRRSRTTLTWVSQTKVRLGLLGKADDQLLLCDQQSKLESDSGFPTLAGSFAAHNRSGIASHPRAQTQSGQLIYQHMLLVQRHMLKATTA